MLKMSRYEKHIAEKLDAVAREVTKRFMDEEPPRSEPESPWCCWVSKDGEYQCTKDAVWAIGAPLPEWRPRDNDGHHAFMSAMEDSTHTCEEHLNALMEPHYIKRSIDTSPALDAFRSKVTEIQDELAGKKPIKLGDLKKGDKFYFGGDLMVSWKVSYVGEMSISCHRWDDVTEREVFSLRASSDRRVFLIPDSEAKA